MVLPGPGRVESIRPPWVRVMSPVENGLVDEADAGRMERSSGPAAPGLAEEAPPSRGSVPRWFDESEVGAGTQVGYQGGRPGVGT